jgi:hypothetical protein
MGRHSIAGGASFRKIGGKDHKTPEGNAVKDLPSINSGVYVNLEI